MSTLLQSKEGKTSIIYFCFMIQFIYSEKATKFCEIFPLLFFDYSIYMQSKERGRFRKILWPSQNVWTLNDSFSSTLIKDSDAEELLHISDINNYSHSVPPSENCDEKHATYNTLKIRVQCHAFAVLTKGRSSTAVAEDLRPMATAMVAKVWGHSYGWRSYW